MSGSYYEHLCTALRPCPSSFYQSLLRPDGKAEIQSLTPRSGVGAFSEPTVLYPQRNGLLATQPFFNNLINYLKTQFPSSKLLLDTPFVTDLFNEQCVA